MTLPGPALPVDEICPELLDALEHSSTAVVEAPPGTGKTTRIPLALLDGTWRGDGRIVVLEPRRVATRAAARRMASTLGEGPGETVGWRTRDDRKVGPRTRIEVVTEGIFTRRALADPGLDGVAAVVFDEWHERSLVSDLGLALALEIQEALRPDLRIVVMSATLDPAAAAAVLGDPPVVGATAVLHPVDVQWRARPAPNRWASTVADATVDALGRQDGDGLVFLPGVGEIERVSRDLAARSVPGDPLILPLHGRLGADDQDRALRPLPDGRRRVVLSTDLAETSVTVDGVRVVVDGGRRRVSRWSPERAMSRLQTVYVSKAAADQRRGRAGRQGPGLCVRLWSAVDHDLLDDHEAPEIVTADLAPLALDLARWGTSDPSQLRWADPPAGPAWARAVDTLRALGVLDGAGRITAHGEAVGGLGLHPRLGHLVITGRETGRAASAALMAAVLDEGDPLVSGRGRPDLRERLEALAEGAGRLDPGRARRVRAQARRIRRRAGIDDGPVRSDDAGWLVAVAHPERIARRREGGEGRFVAVGGGGLAAEGALASEPWLAVAETDGDPTDARIRLAAPLTAAEVDELLADQIEEAHSIEWHGPSGRARVIAERRAGAIVLHRQPLSGVPPEFHDRVRAEEIRHRGLAALSWSRTAHRLVERVGFLHRRDPGHWPDWGDDALLASIEDWLLPQLPTGRRLGDVAVAGALLATLEWPRPRELDELAPERLTLPSGRSVAIDYSDPGAAVIEAPPQELFGSTETPRVWGGREPVTLRLLSPAGRPIQTTNDLAGFWAGSWADVRRDLRGRYPKHPWPEDPAATEPVVRRGGRRRG
ncbi:MAG: ATP-dependent helicase HrpB [Actinomycetia bacterium]|nr:ATP-dependent helicase HrpB [Actinomycetes bacterium]